MDPQGDAIAVWERSTGGGASIIEAAVRSKAGVWEAPVALSHEGQVAYSPAVAVDSNGDAVAVWDRHGPSTSVIEVTGRPAGSGAWQAPVALSAAEQNAEAPQVAMDAQGDAVAVWQQRDASQMIQTAVKPAGSETWQAPVGLSPAGENALLAQIAVDPQGDAVAVWLGSSGGNQIVEATTMAEMSSTWRAPVALSSASDQASEPQVAIDRQGDAVAVWQSATGTNEVIDASFMSGGAGVWESPVAVSTGATSLVGEFPQVAMDPRGDAVAVWDQSNGSNYIVETAVRSAVSGAWQAVIPLSPAGESSYLPQIAVDSQGNAVAIWENNLIEAAGYDASGPMLRSLAIPGMGMIGQPLSFSVAPLDVWSMLGQTNWDFGDGTSATGANVTHVYATAGDYPVTVTGADVLGNTTSATGRVTVGTGTNPCACDKLRVRLLYGVRLTNRRFRVAGHAPAISANAPRGTHFVFGLSAPAKLRIVITRTARGLRRRGGCVAPTAELRDRHAKHCIRTLALGALTRSNEPSGTHSIFFNGRMGHRLLRPHAYKALIEARTIGGREEKTLAFEIVR